MKNKLILLLLSVILISCSEKDYLVTIVTEFGEMKLILFDETPKHKSSFISYVKAGKYDSTTFHRVLKEFMIQGGDVNARPGAGARDHTLIDAEFLSHLIHTKGMLAGARTGTNNPQKKSGIQFYIVQGKKFPRVELERSTVDNYYGKLVSNLNTLFKQGKYPDLFDQCVALQQSNDVEGLKTLVLSNANLVEDAFGPQSSKSYTDDQYELYETLGGAPHLDGEYTVFGRIVEGLDVVDLIAAQQVGARSKPLSAIYMTITVEEVSRKKLTKLYGVSYAK